MKKFLKGVEEKKKKRKIFLEKKLQELKEKKIEDLSKGDQIKAALYARPNNVNGKYRAALIGLDDLSRIKDSSPLQH